MVKSPAPHSNVISPRPIQVTNRKPSTPLRPAASDIASPGAGPRVAKGCMDVACVFLLVVCWIACAISAFFAAYDGCPSHCNSVSRLAYGYDSQGRQCGFGRLTDYPYVHIAAPSHPLTSRVCLPKCPSASLSLPTSLSLPNSMLLCVDKADAFEPAPSTPPPPLCLSSSAPCCHVSYPTIPLSRRCVPSLTAAAAAAANSTVASLIFGSSSSLSAVVAFASNPQGSAGAILQQIGSNLPLLPAAAVAAAIMSFFFCLFLRRAAAFVAIFLLILIFFCLSALSFSLWMQTTLLPPLPPPMPSLSILSLESLPLSPLQCAAAAAICTLLTLAFAAFSISIARRVLPAVAVIQLAAKVLWSAPTVVAVTACGGLLAALVAAAGLILMLLLASAGGFDPMTMTFINSDSADTVKCALAVANAVSPAAYPTLIVSRACSFYSGDSDLAIASLPNLNATALAISNVSVSLVSVQTFQYMMIGCAASLLWTLLWIAAVTTCVTGESASRVLILCPCT
jgi:hypothetical protein